MRIAEYKQIGAESVKRTIHHEAYDEEVMDSVVHHEEWDEEISEIIPVMGMVYRDMTAEEEAEARAEAERMAEIERNREPTAEERLAMVEDAFTELCEVLYG